MDIKTRVVQEMVNRVNHDPVLKQAVGSLNGSNYAGVSTAQAWEEVITNVTEAMESLDPQRRLPYPG